MTSQAMRRRQSMRRDIVKQGYLKKLPNAAKVGSSLKRPERRWFVFGVVGVGAEAEPYLEYYENEDKLFSNNPINMIMLDTCRYVIRNDTNTRYTNVFTLVLKDRHLNLVASRRNEMLDWCGAIESRLKYLGILQSGDNDYIEVPWSRPRPPTQSDFIPPPTATATATLGRNPTSPLPPPPSSPLPHPPTPPSSSSSSPLPPSQQQSTDLSSEDYTDAASSLSLQNQNNGIYENQQIIAWQENPNLNLWSAPQTSASISVPSSPSVATAATARASNLYSQTPGTLRLKTLKSTARITSLPASSSTVQSAPPRAVSIAAPFSSSDTLASTESEESTQATYSVPNKKSTAQQDLTNGASASLPDAVSATVPDSVPDILRDSVPATVSDLVLNTVSSTAVSSPSSPGSPTPPELPPHPTSPLLSPVPQKTLTSPQSELISFDSEITEVSNSTTDSAPIVSFTVSSQASSSPQLLSKSSTTTSSPLNSPSKSPSPPPLPEHPTARSSIMASGGNLIDLDDALDSDEDTYEPVWDQTAVTRNQEETYSVPRPRPRPVNTQNGNSEPERPPILPPKTNQRSSALLNTMPSTGQRSRSPSTLTQSAPPPSRSAASHSPVPSNSPVPMATNSPVASHSPLPAASNSPIPPSGRGSPHVMLPAYSPSYPHTPQVGAEAFPPQQDPSLLSPKMREALGFGAGAPPSTDAVGGWNNPPADTLGAPPPYLPRGALERGANKSLKLSQVEQLQKEMKNSGGVKVVLRRVDCYLTVAIVDAFNAVWIAGWNQQARPFLHNAFHIGDQLISINGQVVESARVAQKLIKHSGEMDKVTFILRRTPNARVLALKREVEGESLGIRRHGGTAEISYVDPAGVGGRQGLPSKAPTVGGDSLCDWWITEVNMRPLNLFFKDNEIEPTLNAVGKDISIMVQPSDFIKELKKQLKAMKKMPYKDFLLR